MKKIIGIILIGISILFMNQSHEYNIPKKEEIDSVIIPKINLNQRLFPIDSPENTIEKSVAILKESTMPNQENSILILAAHSGTGGVAFFKELDKLEINDEIIIKYHNNTYIYQVKDIWEEKKNGFININKENKKQLILTTCSPNKKNKQLIINCTIKES